MIDKGFLTDHLAEAISTVLKKSEIIIREKIAEEIETELSKRCLHERYESLTPFKCAYCTSAKVAGRIARGKK